jgi:hypothetical protein
MRDPTSGTREVDLPGRIPVRTPAELLAELERDERFVGIPSVGHDERFSDQ